MLIKNATYNKHSIIEDSDGPISIFEDVTIINNPSSEKIFFSGTYIPITCTPHYFHFLKEYYGFYLYYKEKYDANAQYLWIDHHYFYPAYQNMIGICDFCHKTLGEGWTITDWHNKNFFIKKLVILFDSQRCIMNESYQQPSYAYTPGINATIRAQMLPRVPQEDIRHKLYLSRKIVSEHLPTFPVGQSNAPLEKWKQDQLRLRYVDPAKEQELEDYYQQQGYTIIQLSGMSLLEQVSLFQHADKVTGLLGTAFYNGIFANEHTSFEALRINPEYYYDFEQDIKTVLPYADFNYKLLY